MKKALFLLAALLPCFLQAAPCPSLQWSVTGQFTGSGDVGSVRTGDVDNDGNVDIIAYEAVNSGPLVLRRGKGDGTFHPASTIKADEIDAPFDVGDVNGDGKLDIVGSRNNGLRVMLGNGSGGFGPTSYLSSDHVHAMLLANFDADPALELAVLSLINDIFIVYDNTDNAGNFAEVRRVATGGDPTAIGAADFDGDGLTDVVVTARTPKTASVYFGKSDGTFTAPAVVATGNFPANLATGDVNGDGRPDLAVSSWEDESVKVYRYTGTRQFTAATTYTLRRQSIVSSAHEVALRDLDGDGDLDLLVVVGNGPLVTLTGMGNGTFRSPSYSDSSLYYGHLGVADFDKDGKLDAVLANSGYRVVESTCAPKVELWPAEPYIDDVDDAILDVHVAGIAPGGPFGTVTLYEDAISYGTLTLNSQGKARFTISDLPAPMDHTFIAQFSGNEEQEQASSNSATIHVHSTHTETIVHLPDYPSTHNEPWPVEIEVRGVGPYPVQVWVTYDGQSTLRSSNTTFYLYPTLGTHTISAGYPGNSGYPPSDSETLTFTTGKASLYVSHSGGSTTIRQGTTQALDFDLSAWDAAGTLALYEGNTFLASGVISYGSARITVPALSRGVHNVRVVFPGDDHYHPDELALTLEVVANSPLALEARGLPSAIHIAWAAPSNANISSLRLYRRPAGTSTWQWLSWWYPGLEFDTDSLERGVVYEYRIQGTTQTGAALTSNVDSAMLFTDEPLAAGLLIKRTHFAELRAAVNLMRVAAGLTPFDYATPLDVVRASHVGSLRTALSQARTALGMSNPAFTPVDAGTVITPAALQQLRELAR